jgi:hypothetical protein
MPYDGALTLPQICSDFAIMSSIVRSPEIKGRHIFMITRKVRKATWIHDLAIYLKPGQMYEYVIID